jgi:hypothetical protein
MHISEGLFRPERINLHCVSPFWLIYSFRYGGKMLEIARRFLRIGGNERASAHHIDKIPHKTQKGEQPSIRIFLHYEPSCHTNFDPIAPNVRDQILPYIPRRMFTICSFLAHVEGKFSFRSRIQTRSIPSHG